MTTPVAEGCLRQLPDSREEEMAKPIELPALSPAQLEIMEIVWEHGEMAASEVRNVLSQSRAVARNTVRTLLERMEEKGWLTHRIVGRTHFYSATQPRSSNVGRRVVEVLDEVCEGSPETLVTALLDHRGLSRGEIQRIRKLLDAARTTKQAKKGR